MKVLASRLKYSPPKQALQEQKCSPPQRAPWEAKCLSPTGGKMLFIPTKWFIPGSIYTHASAVVHHCVDLVPRRCHGLISTHGATVSLVLIVLTHGNAMGHLFSYPRHHYRFDLDDAQVIVILIFQMKMRISIFSIID